MDLILTNTSSDFQNAITITREVSNFYKLFAAGKTLPGKYIFEININLIKNEELKTLLVIKEVCIL